MATPMKASQMTAALNKWGINYEPYKSNWATHNRNHKGEWGGVNGVMIHHTGSDSNDARVLWEGYAGLPGPLCHAGLRSNGQLILTGHGRANHAGKGDRQVFEKVVAENYSGVLKPNGADMDFNQHFYGLEIMYSGSKPMSGAQRKTSLLWAAAICDFHGWNEKSCIGHGEAQPGKWDPGYPKGRIINMAIFRTELGKLLHDGPPKEKPVPQPTPKPTPISRDDYVVKVGDTLWSIAEKYLGHGKFWPDLVEKNPHLVNLQPGEVIKLPEK